MSRCSSWVWINSVRQHYRRDDGGWKKGFGHDWKRRIARTRAGEIGRAYRDEDMLTFSSAADVDIRVRVRGGGHVSQVFAIRQAIAKSIVSDNMQENVQGLED
jgi:hypothetical protein